MTSPIRLHGIRLSGHAHKVELFLRLLDLPYEYVETPPDSWSGEAFGKLNPLRQVPVIQDGDFVLADSNAILVYLAGRYDPDGPWSPREPQAAAMVQRWLSISAGEIRFGPAKARVIKLLGAPGDLEASQAIANQLLAVMEQHLATREWLVGDTITLADIACYPYLACAGEGGVDVAVYPAVSAWVARLEALPRMTPMLRTPAAA